MKKEWYVVPTVTGYEYKVKEKLEMMIKNSEEIQQKIFRVIVPEHTVIEFKDGVKKEKVKKMFPGYVLVEMIMDDEVWYIVRNTQGVTGLLGSSGKGAKPIPLSPEEVERILNTMGMSRMDLSKDLVEGKKVKLVSGPFKDMIGKIESFDMEKKKVNLLLDLFGQETSVEANLSEIENIQ